MSFKKIRVWLSLVLVVSLAACGGGGSSGTAVLGGGASGGGSTGGSSAAKVDVRSSNATLGDGDSTVTLTAVVKDANDAIIAKAPVAWSFSTGKLVDASAVTDASGAATATYSASDRTAPTSVITVTSGEAKGSVTVNLQALRTISVDSPAKVLGVAINGQVATITTTVKDLNNVAISGAGVSWSTDVGTLRNITSATNASGQATAVFEAGSILPGGISPKATITVTSGASTGSIQIPINAVFKSIEMLADTVSIGSGGDTATIRAFVKNGVTNAALPGQPVTWSASSGTLSIVSSVTDSSGVATAVLSAGSSKVNRDIEVTVSSDSASQTLRMPVVNTRLTISSASSTTKGSTIQLNLAAVDSKGIPIPRTTLLVTSKLGNTVINSVDTDGAGQATVNYSASNTGTDTIVVSGAGATVSATIVVSGTDESLTFTTPGPGSSVPIGSSQQLVLKYLKAGVPQANKTLNLSATIGTLSSNSVVTDGNGISSPVSITSSFAGGSIISAALAGGAVQTTMGLAFVATVPASLVLQGTPSALSPNTSGSTAQQAALFAKVTDANGNPVSGVVVNFAQVADPSHGTLSQASASTDLTGVATVQFLSGPDSTASGAVKLKASVASNPAVSGEFNLTVNGEALFIVLGTGNTISNYDAQTYEKNWTVYVTDANGVQVPNKKVTLKIIPSFYFKGYLVWNDIAGFWIDAIPRLRCANEDINFSGIFDPLQDTNGDGTLTPGNVVFLGSSTVTTDSNGTATVTMRYAELYASWITVRLTASATVGGTESTTFKEFPLDKLAGDYNQKTIAPAGVISPFGIDTSTCTNAR